MVRTYTTDRPLTCRLEEQGCRMPTFTYGWNLDYEKCPLTLLSRTRGVEVKNKDNQSVFISDDGKQTRLLLKGTRSFCGRLVFGTNQFNTVLYPTTAPSIFRATSTMTFPRVLTTPFKRTDEHFNDFPIHEQSLNNSTLYEEYVYTMQSVCRQR